MAVIKIKMELWKGDICVCDFSDDGEGVKEEKMHVHEKGGGMWGPGWMGIRLSGPQLGIRDKDWVNTDHWGKFPSLAFYLRGKE